MAKLFLALVVAAVVCAQKASSLECYVCTGYQSDQPEDIMQNNPSCVSGSFDGSKVQTETVEVSACSATRMSLGKVSMTTRSTGPFVDLGIDGLEGYSCDTDLCNGKDINAAGAVSAILSLLVVPVVLLRLLS